MAEDREKTGRRERKPSLVIAALLLLIIFGAATGALSLALGKGSLGFEVFKSYFQNSWLLLFNLAPVVVLHIAVYMLVGRPWLAFLLSSGGVLFFSFLEGLKIKQVSDVIWFSDIVSGEAFDYISDGSAVRLDLLSIACVVYLIAVTTLLLVLFLKRRSPWFAGRIILFAVMIAGSVWGYKEMTNTEKYGGLTRNDECVDVNYEYQRYVSKGFVYPLMLSAADKGLTDAPGGYSAENAAALLDGYPADDIPEDTRLSLIVIQLESFADIRDRGLEGLDEELASAYMEYDRIRGRSVSGILATAETDAASADPERRVLTGFVSPGTIRTYTDSCAHYLRSQGFRTAGIYPGVPKLMGRGRVNEYLGFEDFRYSILGGEEISGPFSNTDWILYSKVYDLWKEGADAGRSKQFIFAESTQNAGPYDRRFSINGHGADGTSESPEGNVTDTGKIRNYLEGVRNSFYYLSFLLDRLESEQEPVAVLIYSDHGPDLDYGAEDSGVCMDTRYIMWRNTAANEAFGAQAAGTGRTVSQNFLMAEFFGYLGLGGPAFMKASRSLSDELPVLLDNGMMILSGQDGPAEGLPLSVQTLKYDHDHMEYYEKTNFRYKR
ncbi:MAG: hypothetical protein IJM61_00700 [Firmicutes bacterium]|nr:hypothetical protein [Bacillota bacterium]